MRCPGISGKRPTNPSQMDFQQHLADHGWPWDVSGTTVPVVARHRSSNLPVSGVSSRHPVADCSGAEGFLNTPPGTAACKKYPERPCWCSSDLRKSPAKEEQKHKGGSSKESQISACIVICIIEYRMNWPWPFEADPASFVHSSCGGIYIISGRMDQLNQGRGPSAKPNICFSIQLHSTTNYSSTIRSEFFPENPFIFPASRDSPDLLHRLPPSLCSRSIQERRKMPSTILPARSALFATRQDCKIWL